MKENKILIDNFGNLWKVIEGDITYGDWAFNHDTGDVLGIDEDDDLYLRNETCSRVDPIYKPVENNKLIAEFMGIECGDYITPHYHFNWNELMPVVEKIEENGYDFIASRRRATRTYDANFMDEANNYLVYVEGCKDRQEATYKAVVEFIKQLNK